MRIDQRYNQIFEFIQNGLKDRETHARAVEYRERLFGYVEVVGAPAEYYELQVMFELHISPTEWKKLSVSDRGKFAAYLQLKNMSETLNYHEMYQRQEREAEQADSDAKRAAAESKAPAAPAAKRSK